MVILLIVVVVFLVLLVGMLLAFLFTRLDHTVVTTRVSMAAEERAYNPGVTLGHRIKLEADYEEQLRQARLEAAKKAAATPRGANSRFGRDGESTLATAGKSADIDAVTAVRVARFHGWDGVRTGAPSVNALAATPVAVATPVAAPSAAAPTIPPPVLITITDSMSPEEVRKARIANAKAESAYNKALKAAGSGAPVAAAAAPAGVPAAVAQAAVPAAAAHIDKPKLIEITPDMAPEDVRKARVANAKAESAYNKALKAAGVTSGAAQPVAAAAGPAVSQPAVSAAPAPTGIAPPQLIEITDSMAPEEIRRARVANAKAESAYNKALKAAGIDPAAVKAGATVADAPAASTQPAIVEAPVAAAPAAPAGGPQIPAGIERPKLIEITDAMAPEEIRRARVENAKAQSAFNKALKAAGIDPASVK